MINSKYAYVKDGERKIEALVLAQLEALLGLCENEELASEDVINFVSDICHDWVREKTE